MRREAWGRGAAETGASARACVACDPPAATAQPSRKPVWVYPHLSGWLTLAPPRQRRSQNDASRPPARPEVFAFTHTVGPLHCAAKTVEYRGEPLSTIPRGGKPFQSKLEPHFDLIARLRRDRKTWAEIAAEVGRRGTKCTPQGVCVFLKRRRRRRYALGMEPENHPAAQEPAPVPAPLRGRPSVPVSKPMASKASTASGIFESLVDEAEATTRQQHRTKSVTVIRPKPGTPL